MVKSRITELISKKLGKDASNEELDELSGLLVKYPEYAYLHELLYSLKGSKSHFEKDVPKEELVNHGWEDLANKLNTKQEFFEENENSSKSNGLIKKINNFRKIWIVAATITLLIGCSIFYYKEYFIKHQLATDKKIEEVHYGSTSKLTLSDGTQVWLNAGSKLTYPEKFSGTKREVTLEGEGFFEVTKNAHLPFLVHAGTITVRVLGTRFNVKAYNEDADIETTLISGKVQIIMDDDPEKEIILSPHEKLTIKNQAKSESKNSANEQINNELKYQVQSLPVNNSTAVAETAWVENKLIFNNESFDNVARMLERRYDVHITFDNESLKDEHVTGVFEKENILQALQVLGMTTHFNYKADGNNIHLY
ncbi:MAG TPA: FecR domain-containing protein [Puia sp.]|nr:FecR domain-containing protein [Puia sp.]